ncbi:MAG: glycosyltransferase family 2 protein [Acidimicrobiales bacterium]
MAGPPPRVLISIVNHENRDLLRACLQSLPAACAGLEWEATVVDNVSKDGSLEMLAAEFPLVRVMANRQRLGFGANHNQALRPLLASWPDGADFVLVLNDDTVVEPTAVSRLVAALYARPALAAVVPTIRDTAGRTAASRLAYPDARSAWHADWTDQLDTADPDDGYLQGCCLLLRVEALVEVGPFDERFFLFFEDVDLSRRLRDAGWSLGVCPEAVVVHEGHASVFKPDLIAVTPLQGRRSRYLYLCKYEGRARAEAITGVGRLLLVIRAAKAAVGAVIADGPSTGQSGQARRRDRARRLWALARFNPRRPLPPDPGARCSDREPTAGQAPGPFEAGA